MSSRIPSLPEHPVFRAIFWFAGCSTFFYAFLLFWSWLLNPGYMESLPEFPEAEVERAEALRATPFDPEDPLVLYREVDYTAGSTAPWWPREESPVLKSLVETGVLPPLIDRVGPEPVVYEPVDTIGEYGGTFIELVPGSGDAARAQYYYSGGGLVKWSPQGYPIVPHLAKTWEVNEDLTEWTFTLRKGLRWSDGHPFTADDILYWWQVEQLSDTNPEISRLMLVNGKPGDIEKVDDLTVRFTFPLPHGIFLERLATWDGRGLVDAPKHYLEKYHVETGDPEFIEENRKVLQSPTATAAYTLRIKRFDNPEHPRMWPWVYRAHKPNPPFSWVRNPYYPVVDTTGRQLPYIDRWLYKVANPQMISAASSSGEYPLLSGGFNQYSLLMDKRQDNHYRVLHWFDASRAPTVLQPNLNKVVDPMDPGSEWKKEYLSRKQFRQALSLAVNRERIIRFEYRDVVVPSNLSPGERSDFTHPGSARAWSEFDPQRANRMLDAIGLDRRDSEGMRTFPDGTPMLFFIATQATSGFGSAGGGLLQSVVQDWAAVGIRARVRELSSSVYVPGINARRHDWATWTSNTEHFPLLGPRYFLPIGIHSHFAPAWSLWYRAGGLSEEDPSELPPGAIPVPLDHPFREGIKAWESAMRTNKVPEQVEHFRRVLDIAEENLWLIAFSTSTPILVMVQEDLRNVPAVVVSGWDLLTPENAYPETWFFRERRDSTLAQDEIRSEIETVVPRPNRARALARAEGQTDLAAFILRSLMIGTAFLTLVLAGLRHPYIGRRLLLMIPTLGVISVVVFTIIQLPPGDYLTTRQAELEATGRDVDLEEVEKLREMFYLDRSPLERYLRWTGLYWFASFDRQDLGLLQGYMGRSMETQESVNNLVGDRILLTMAISLGTILFTWMVAVPIGIYSAVRQYSKSDYAVSLAGFVGMSIPDFLLALLLSYLSREFFGVSITGLFSSDFEGQPEWTLAKFLDLLQHIWVPIVIVGFAGTAGMIRVMRGNLLDELKKPYVTTARAKGVRPVKLLFKYPVRMALNPFVSGIGGIFPQLVSGGAVVALVLSLPTVGPLLLDSLFKQDMYMAGSMLMVLSLLGVMGTLVSDLLLMVMDPRIRMSKGIR